MKQFMVDRSPSRYARQDEAATARESATRERLMAFSGWAVKDMAG